mmetsp:Transcript_77716/g.170156  ORF Transcript_77716/g.170156 Transcript_77716/m.170156 type:complete len:220 (-) Transcript_77716:453-1112(-)
MARAVCVPVATKIGLSGSCASHASMIETQTVVFPVPGGPWIMVRGTSRMAAATACLCCPFNFSTRGPDKTSARSSLAWSERGGSCEHVRAMFEPKTIFRTSFWKPCCSEGSRSISSNSDSSSDPARSAFAWQISLRALHSRLNTVGNISTGANSNDAPSKSSSTSTSWLRGCNSKTIALTLASWEAATCSVLPKNQGPTGLWEELPTPSAVTDSPFSPA